MNSSISLIHNVPALCMVQYTRWMVMAYYLFFWIKNQHNNSIEWIGRIQYIVTIFCSIGFDWVGGHNRTIVFPNHWTHKTGIILNNWNLFFYSTQFKSDETTKRKNTIIKWNSSNSNRAIRRQFVFGIVFMQREAKHRYVHALGSFGVGPFYIYNKFENLWVLMYFVVVALFVIIMARFVSSLIILIIFIIFSAFLSGFVVFFSLHFHYRFRIYFFGNNSSLFSD